jgi:hypothetical protein
MPKRYSKDEWSTIYGAHRSISLQLNLLREIDRDLPFIMLVGLLCQEPKGGSKPTRDLRGLFGLTSTPD